MNQWLTQLNLDVDDLECGVTPPFTESVRLKLSHDHATITQLHHCCSGKHTGMLSVCQHVGWQTKGYTAYDHPLQAKIREHMTMIFGIDANATCLRI